MKLDELAVIDAAVKNDPVRDGEVLRESLQRTAAGAVVADVQLDRQLSGDERDRAEQGVELLLGAESADTEHPVTGGSLVAVVVAVQVDAAGDRDDGLDGGVLFDVAGGEWGRAGDQIGTLECVRGGVPAEAGERGVQCSG